MSAIAAREQTDQAGHSSKQPVGDRVQLPDMTEGKRPQERAQRGRSFHPRQHLVHRSFAEHVEIVDAVRADDHPGHDRGDLRGGIHAGRARH